ncbi:cms1 ribosomal small subunit, partial [Tieghemiomyces parasiticus]
YFSDPAVAFGTPEAQASFMNHKLRHAFKGISQLELEGASFKSSYFIDSSDFVNPRTPSVLPDWFGKYGNVTFGGSRVKVAKGTPKVLIITCHANRATELIRESRKLAPKVQVAKLFARHMKIEEQRKLLKKFHTDVAVGTPNRILKLMEDPASLTLGRTELIILDCFRDGKDRMVVDMPDCSQDLFILFRQFFLPQLDAGKLRVGMF